MRVPLCQGCGSPIFCLTPGRVGRGQEAEAAEEEEEEKEAEEEAVELEAADLPGRCGYIHPTMATSENKTARLAAGHVG